jgi:hypothetical protein
MNGEGAAFFFLLFSALHFLFIFFLILFPVILFLFYSVSNSN